jgi:hypothetical protein
VNVYTMAEMR